MDRRDFIKQTGFAAATATVGSGLATAAQARSTAPAAPSSSAGRRELRVAMPWLQNGRGFDDSVRRLSASLTTLSAGRLTLSVLPGVHGVAAIASGEADAYHGSGRDFVGLDPAFAFFSGLPGKAAMRPTYLNAWLTAAGGQTLWDDLGAAHGFKPFFVGHAGGRAKLWSRSAITGPDELKGRRIAATGLSAEIVDGIGAIAVDVPSTKLAAALDSGEVDAVEWGATVAGYACDLHTAARHCYAPGLSRSGFTSVFAIGSGVWQSLSPSDQALFTAAVTQELNAVVAESLSISHQLRLGLAARHGVAFEPLPADVAAAAAAAADEAVGSLAAANARAARIHASYSAFRAGLPKRRKSPAAPIA